MKIVFLTGAGISAESGIKTFRDSGGLWEGHDVMQVASPQGFRDGPNIVHQFYNARRVQLDEVEPNPAHTAIVRLAQEHDVVVVTQNVDDLHERAGLDSARAIHIHGKLRDLYCTECGHHFSHVGEWQYRTPCPDCGDVFSVRPDIVWFGEMPYDMQEAANHITDADLYIQVGTSSQVYPANQLHWNARCPKIEVNMEKTDLNFNHYYIGKAGEQLPRLVDDILNGEFE